MKKYKKIILNIGLLSSITFLSGCEKTNNVDNNISYTSENTITNEISENNYYEEYEKNTEINTTEEIIEATPSTEIQTTEIVTTEEITTEEYNYEDTVNDSNSFNNFRDEINELNWYYEQETYDKAKEYGKNLFIKMVDYIFYGSEINGTTFDELNEESKAEVYENLKKTDEIIMKIDKDYKEKLGEKYNIVKDFTVNKYNDALDLIRNKIGDEKYEEIGEKKDEIIDKAKETGNKTKKLIKDWYEDFRDE